MLTLWVELWTAHARCALGRDDFVIGSKVVWWSCSLALVSAPAEIGLSQKYHDHCNSTSQGTGKHVVIAAAGLKLLRG